MSDAARRKVLKGVLAGFAAGTVVGAGAYGFLSGPDTPREAFQDVMDDVAPRDGVTTAIRFGDVLQKLIAAGVLIPAKLQAVYARRGGMPPWVAGLLAGPSDAPIRLAADTATHLLHLLWPVGLATSAPFNATSPTNGAHLPRLASTAGWTIGRARNGAAYFDRVETMALTTDQAETVRELAARIYRPCCDNSALFQDCNHGSAMLGLLELGASQGLDTAELEKVALVANSFWFPREYLKTALFFSIFEKISWKDVPPRELLGKRFSSGSGWQENINVALQMTSLIPRQSLIRMNSAMCRL